MTSPAKAHAPSPDGFPIHLIQCLTRFDLNPISSCYAPGPNPSCFLICNSFPYFITMTQNSVTVNRGTLEPNGLGSISGSIAWNCMTVGSLQGSPSSLKTLGKKHKELIKMNGRDCSPSETAIPPSWFCSSLCGPECPRSSNS